MANGDTSGSNGGSDSNGDKKKKTSDSQNQNQNGETTQSDSQESQEQQPGPETTQEALREVAQQYDEYSADDLVVNNGKVQPSQEAQARERQELKQEFAAQYDAFGPDQVVVEDGTLRPSEAVRGEIRNQQKQEYAETLEDMFTISPEQRARESVLDSGGNERQARRVARTIDRSTEDKLTLEGLDLTKQDVGFRPVEGAGAQLTLNQSGRQKVNTAKKRTLAEQLSQTTGVDLDTADVTPQGGLTQEGERDFEEAFAERVEGVGLEGVDVEQSDGQIRTTFTERGEQQLEQRAAQQLPGVDASGIELERQGDEFRPVVTERGEQQLERYFAESIESQLTQTPGERAAESAAEAGANRRAQRRVRRMANRGAGSTATLDVDLGPNDVEAITTDEGFGGELTESGWEKIEEAQEDRVVSSFDRQLPTDVEESDVTKEGDEWTLSEQGRQELREYQTEQAETAVEEQIEEQENVNLDDEDVTVERTTNDQGETVFQGSLTDRGEQELAGQNAPGSNLPWVGDALAGVAETTVKIDQGTNDFIDDVTPDNLPSLPKVPLPSKEQTAVTAGAAVAVPEPVSTGSGALVLGGLAVAGIAASTVKETGTFQGPPTASAAYQGSEVDVPTRNQWSELPVQQPTQERSELGIGGTGVTATEVGLPTSGIFPNELEPGQGQPTSEIPVTGPGNTGQQTGQQTGDSVVPGDYPLPGRDVPANERLDYPGDGMPELDFSVSLSSVTAGEIGTGTQTPPTTDQPTQPTNPFEESQPTAPWEQAEETEVDQPTREFPTGESAVVNRGRVTEDVQQRTEQAQRREVDFGEVESIEPARYERATLGEGTGTGPSVTPGPRSISEGVESQPFRDVTPESLDRGVSRPFGDTFTDANPGVSVGTSPLQMSDTATRQLTPAETATPTQVTPTSVETSTIVATENPNQMETEFPTETINVGINTPSPRKPRKPPRLPDLPDLGTDYDDDDDRKRDRKSDLFDNPVINPNEAFTFDPFED